MVEKRILGFCIDCLITSSSDAAVKGADSRGKRQKSYVGLGKIVCFVLVCSGTRGIQANWKGVRECSNHCINI